MFNMWLIINTHNVINVFIYNYNYNNHHNNNNNFIQYHIILTINKWVDLRPGNMWGFLLGNHLLRGCYKMLH